MLELGRGSAPGRTGSPATPKPDPAWGPRADWLAMEANPFEKGLRRIGIAAEANPFEKGLRRIRIAAEANPFLLAPMFQAWISDDGGMTGGILVFGSPSFVGEGKRNHGEWNVMAVVSPQDKYGIDAAVQGISTEAEGSFGFRVQLEG